jgi:hypothetical protein
VSNELIVGYNRYLLPACSIPFHKFITAVIRRVSLNIAQAAEFFQEPKGKDLHKREGKDLVLDWGLSFFGLPSYDLNGFQQTKVIASDKESNHGGRAFIVWMEFTSSSSRQAVSWK